MTGITGGEGEGVDASMDMNVDETRGRLLSLGGDDSKDQYSDPDKEVLLMKCPECSNDPPDCLAWDMIGNEGGDMEGVMV